MDNAEQNANQFVFGLDIGTRNVVGTVGYREGKDFYVAAQYMKAVSYTHLDVYKRQLQIRHKMQLYFQL